MYNQGPLTLINSTLSGNTAIGGNGSWCCIQRKLFGCRRPIHRRRRLWRRFHKPHRRCSWRLPGAGGGGDALPDGWRRGAAASAAAAAAAATAPPAAPSLGGNGGFGGGNAHGGWHGFLHWPWWCPCRRRALASAACHLQRNQRGATIRRVPPSPATPPKVEPARAATPRPRRPRSSTITVPSR